MDILFFRRGWNQQFKVSEKFRNVRRDDAPDAVIVDLAILMSEHVPLGDDAVPGDLRVLQSELRRDMTSGLADKLGRSFQCTAQC